MITARTTTFPPQTNPFPLTRAQARLWETIGKPAEGCARSSTGKREIKIVASLAEETGLLRGKREPLRACNQDLLNYGCDYD